MDDLISRMAAIEAVNIPNGEYPPIDRHGIIIARIAAKRRIMELPSAPAVPLDKLCELLGEYICPPDKVDHERCLTERCELCWKDYLTKWTDEQNT